MKYMSKEACNRAPFLNQNYGTEFNMERIQYLFDQLAIVHDDLPSNFFNDSRVYESFNALRGHAYERSIERFNLTTRQLNRMRKPCELSHKDAMSQYISQTYTYLVPAEAEIDFKKVRRVDRYNFDLLHGEQAECYTKLAFKNMEYIYAVADYLIEWSRIACKIVEDCKFKSSAFTSMTNDVYYWGVKNREYASLKMLAMAVASNDQEYIKSAMFTIGKDRFIRQDLDYNLESYLSPMGKKHNSYKSSNHEDQLHAEINSYYGINNEDTSTNK